MARPGRLTAAIALALSAVAALLIAFSAPPPTALAQDIRGLDTKLRTDAIAGPYTVTAEAKPLPSLQAVQFFVTVADTASGNRADDVRVEIITSHQGSAETGFALTTKIDTPGVFLATVTMETPGVWETDLLIESPAGDTYGVEGFAFEVFAPTSTPEAGFVFIGVAVVLIVGGAYLVWQIRRTQRRRAARIGNTAV